MLITCIIPTRNRPDYITQSAASVLAQSHADLELIIVNDGHVAVPPIADSRARVLSSGEAGAVPARNMGAAAAKGEAIAWLDDDDVWTDADFLSACVKLFAGGNDFIFGDGSLVFPDSSRKSFARDADAASLALDNTILISAVCYRRSLHQRLGTFDTSLPYYWDWDWYLRVARDRHVMTRLQKPVVDIRIHASNMSGNANATAREENLRALERKHSLAKIPLKSHVDFV